MSVVVVHRGARDHYQTALALSEAGLLDTLVTDLYWRADSDAARLTERILPQGMKTLLRARLHPELPAQQVRTLGPAAFASFAADKISATPFQWRARVTRATDARLGREAGAIARAHGSAILSYSYYAHDAFEAAGANVPRMLFQMHPHPGSMRRILRAELARHPECAASLESEWELGLSDAEFNRLAGEPNTADFALAASSFTRQTLVENGFAPERVFVVPYGVDLERYQPAQPEPHAKDRPLRILFAGTVSQRKGIKYLLEAVRQFGTRAIELRIRGRAVDDLALVRRMVPSADIRLSVSNEELLDAYQTSDLFVFPSVAEGFGHVLIEAMACGLPILSTTRTAAVDLVTEGRDGFVVPPSRTDAIAERLEWALTHRAALAAMKVEARRKAETFTWSRYRAGLAAAVAHALAVRQEAAVHV
jgi:glycosyltransferase involved in cell wall biosynthesis